MDRIRGLTRSRRGRAVIVGAAIVLLVGFVIVSAPRRVDGVGTLDQCNGHGWAVIVFDGEVGYQPVEVWPAGMRYDEPAGELRDAQGSVLFRRGERVHVKGVLVEVHGDPSPCWITGGVNVESIASPSP